MLIPPEDVTQEIDRIMAALDSGEIDHMTAGERIRNLDPEDSNGYLLLGNSAGDEEGNPAVRERIEDHLWQALLRSPCSHVAYLGLAAARGAPGDAFAKGISVLGMWKLAMAEEIPEDIAEQSREIMAYPGLDWSNPDSYEILANTWEEEIEEAGEPPEVTGRLLPYRLLNRLQLESHALTAELVREIVDHAAACAPVFRGALWEWGRDDRSVDAPTLCLCSAFLGEIAGIEVLPELLVLATHADIALMLHAHWGIHRLAERFPEEVFAEFRSGAPGAGVSLRCALAEQLGLLPDVPGRDAAILDLVQDFPRIAKEEDAPYLLLTACYSLERIGRTLQSKETMLRFERLLPKEGRDWIRQMVESEGGFAPLLAAHGVDTISLEEVVVNRALSGDEEEPHEDEDEWDEDDEGGEDEPAEPVIVKPGRNDPCWCGSGKKYKKCHLDEDEEKARSAKEEQG